MVGFYRSRKRGIGQQKKTSELILRGLLLLFDNIKSLGNNFGAVDLLKKICLFYTDGDDAYNIKNNLELDYPGKKFFVIKQHGVGFVLDAETVGCLKRLGKFFESQQR